MLNTFSGPQDSLFEEEVGTKPRASMNLADMVSMTSVNGGTMNQTCQYNTKTFETLNSQDSLLGASFTSNYSKRIAEAMKKHTSLQFKWLKQIERIN